MDKSDPAGDQLEIPERQMQQLSLAADAEAPLPAETPESTRFRALPQELQRRILSDYPRALATAMHQYSTGADCEAILMQLFGSSVEMLRVRNTQGDAPMSVALLQGQDGRADKLVELAHRRNPAALDSRSLFGETLLMLSTSSSSAATLMERLLQRDPTQLHRLYDLDGRNILHHCALEESVVALDAALRLTAMMISEGKLSASQVAAAVHMNDRSGDTPMHLMARRNKRDMLVRLLEFGSEVSIHINLDERQHRDRRWTPLMLAVREGAEETAEFLVSRGADPYEEDTAGETALSMTAGNVRMLRILGEEAEDAVAPAAEVASSDGPAWMTAGPAVRTVDSGMGTYNADLLSSASFETTSSAPLSGQSSLSQEVISQLEAGLGRAGKVDAFLVEFQASYATDVALARISENPVTSLISNLAHHHHCRCLVRVALQNVGEPQLASGI